MRRSSVTAFWALLVLLPQAGCATPSPGLMTAATAAPQASNKSAMDCVSAGEVLERDGNIVQAVARYEQANQLDPSLRQASYHLALLHDRAGHDQEALAEYQRLLKATPNDSQLLNDLGVFHYDRGRWTEAEAFLRKAIQSDPQNQRAWTNLGRALGQQKRYQESFAAFAKVLRPAEAHCNVGLIMAHNGNRDDAIREFEEAHVLDPQLRQVSLALTAFDSR